MPTSAEMGVKEDTNQNIIVSGKSSLVRIIPFALSIPPSTLQGWDEPVIEEDKEQQLTQTSEVGVVGTLTMMEKSAIIWLGWGKIQSGVSDSDSKATEIVGKGIPTMGPLVVAMPRTQYQGAFSANEGESSCSQLISGDGEDQLIGWQMASRLTQRVGHPIFVSCSLAADMAGMEGLITGLDRNSLCHRTAALAEREVGRLLGEQQATN